MRAQALALLAILLLAPAALAQAATSMPLPAPTAEARWSYDTVLHADQTVTANATTRMARVEPVDVGGQTHQAYRVETIHGGQREGETVVTWLRVSDMAKLRVAFLRPGGETVFALDQPCAEWRFPMRVGDSWTTSCTFAQGGQPPFTIASNWSVVRAESVTVPAGTFDALVLEQRGDTFVERWWFAPAACWWVRHESQDLDGTPRAREDLTRVEGCSPAASTPAPTAGTPAGATPTGATPAGTAPTGTTPAGATPTGAAPTPTTGAPTATTPAPTRAVNGATPPGAGDQDTPAPGLVALVAAAAVALALLRRRA